MLGWQSERKNFRTGVPITTGKLRRLVSGPTVIAFAVGMTQADIGGRAMRTVSYTDIRHVNPVFHGDTLYAASTVIIAFWFQGAKNCGGSVPWTTHDVPSDCQPAWWRISFCEIAAKP